MSGKSNQERLGNPKYLGWRSELLARLALSRLDNAAIAEDGPTNKLFNFELSGGPKTIHVLVCAFSSLQRLREGPENAKSFTWEVDRRLTTAFDPTASASILMLFDVDSEEGRATRIDNIVDINCLIMEAGQAISKESLQGLIDSIMYEDTRENRPSARVDALLAPGILKPENKKLRLSNSIHGIVEFSEFEAAILDSAPLTRLRHCLGHPTLHLVYPGADARATVFEHAVGNVAIIDKFLRSVASDPVSCKALETLSKRSMADIHNVARVAALVRNIGYQPFDPVRVVNASFAVVANYSSHIEDKWRARLLSAGPLQQIIDQFLPADGGKSASVQILDVINGTSDAMGWLSEFFRGDLDVDRLDYLLRDGMATGLGMAVNLSSLASELKLNNLVGTLPSDIIDQRSAASEICRLSFAAERLNLYGYLHPRVRSFKCHWDRFCSSLISAGSEEDFYQNTTIALREEIQKKADSDEDAHAIVVRKAFPLWATKQHLEHGVRNRLLGDLVTVCQNSRERTLLDAVTFKPTAATEFNQIRLIIRQEIRGVEKLGLSLLKVS